MKKYFLFFIFLVGPFINAFAQKKAMWVDSAGWKPKDPIHGWNLILPEYFENINAIVNYRRENVVANRVREIIGAFGLYNQDTSHLYYNRKGLLTEQNGYFDETDNFKLALIYIPNIYNMQAEGNVGSEPRVRKYNYDSEDRIKRITYVEYHDSSTCEYYDDIEYAVDGKISDVIISSPCSKKKVKIDFAYDSHGKIKELTAREDNKVLYEMSYHNLYDDETGRLLLKKYYFNDSLMQEEYFYGSSVTINKMNIGGYTKNKDSTAQVEIKVSKNESIWASINGYGGIQHVYYADDGSELAQSDVDINDIGEVISGDKYISTYMASHLTLTRTTLHKYDPAINNIDKYIYKFW